ncbi:MAG: bifunctional (p)ppGpp synthetase/guanosine-3',5'-bis(diphosphate) 3'-pyrophosphohydrolase [Erysipelotrichaceae bacterium]|nr:bifunctional (p)ppGpp synthetase/guanosine-3',5'-bis(diphosphate) 3'-pyrophosphohydrolase [Erysipelotrichaceae bacterium]
MAYIEHTIEDVENLYTQYIHNKDDLKLIRHSFEYALEKHEGQFRKSGQPYIIHAIEVAYLVCQLQGGPTTIAAAFLHDTIEDCGVTQQDLIKEFNEDVAEIVFSLTKIKALSHQRRHDKDFVAEGHRKIFLGMAKDIRVIIIKLCDRLHNMRTLDFQTPEKKIRISRETLEVYAPIADRLGLNEIKGELQDLCLKYLEPNDYLEIQEFLNTKVRYREESIQKLEKKIADMLLPTKIPFEIKARVKRPYSIWKKLKEKQLTFETIYDIVALRIITQTELNCYEILGLIHSEYSPLPGRFKDYVAVPKPNMYQSLHTTIIDRDSSIIEIQIRTKEMDIIAENGVAAHWRYKENSKYDPKKEQLEIMEKLHWFSDFVAMSNENEDSREYMDSLQKDIFEANIYCFTPHGKVIDLPNGATPLDFAFKVHTKVGERAIGAMVNNQLVPLGHKLKTGDVVEIKTSQNANINRGWLNIVTTNSAKNIIKKYLAKQNADFIRENNIQKGRDSLIEVFKDNGITEQKMDQLINQEVLKIFNLETSDDLFLQIASRTILPSVILDKLGLRQESTIDSFIKKNTSSKKSNFSNQSVLVKGTPNILCTLSPCCSPIPGDNIVGYVSQGKGIKVHRKDCPNVSREKDKNRLIDVEWNPACKETMVPVQVVVRASDRDSLLVDILNLLSQLKIPCNKIMAKSHRTTFTSTITMTIQIKNIAEYRDVRDSLINIGGVYQVERVTH